MKIKKRITAMGAAMVMAISMMSMGAGAYQVSEGWRLNYASAPGMPTSAYHTNIDLKYQPQSENQTFSVFNENCSSFSSGVSSNGVHAKVRYWAYVADRSGKAVAAGFGSCYHEVKNSSFIDHTLANRVNFDYRLVVRYELINTYSVSCEMSGTYRIN